MKKTLRVGLFLTSLGACSGKDPVDTGVIQVAGPELAHDVPTGDLVEGDSVELTLQASDPDGVSGAIVFHRTEGSTYWDSTPLDPADGGLWTVTLSELNAPGLEYYFKGIDNGTPEAESVLPNNGLAEPFVVSVAARAAALPWTEDFELEEGETSLFTLGWWTPSDAFNGYPFQLTSNRAVSGTSSAYHPRGTASVGSLEDWLISPAVDLSSLPAAMVTWQELGVSTSAMNAHSLWISTTSRDPSDGGFVVVDAELAVPLDGEWGRSKAYDLSAWAGSPQAYLAWRYEGEMADDWYIDDVTVGALAADLSASVLWLPDPVGPGEDVSVTVVFTNDVDAATEPLVATLALPEGGGVISQPEVEVGSIEGLGSGQADFVVSLDPELAENRYLPLVVDVTDGEQSWTFDLQITVGTPSTARVDLTVDGPVSANVVVGVGDPDAPAIVETVWTGLLTAGAHELTLDVTDWFELLPPTAGEGRWFAEVTADGSGSFDEFSIEWGGERFAASRLGVVFPDVPTRVYVPEPPSPRISSVSPTSASPGDVDLPLSLTVRNDGEASAGPVTGEVVSLDPDVTVSSGATFTLDEDIWEGGESHSVQGPEISIGEGHADSTPARFEIVLSDGVETWSEEFEIAVPWPVLKITSVVIDDSGGDGVLDADESAEIELTVVNTGDLAVFAPLDGVLSVDSSSTAAADLTVSEGSFGRLSPGADRDDDFSLTVVSGGAGDVLDLVLDLSDGTAEYQASVQLVLGEPPWLSLAATDDSIGDNLSGYDFDFVNARYRVVGTTVELILASHVPLDPATLFVEAWGSASGADYTYYRWVLQSGVGTLQGYTGSAGFQTIGTLTASFPSANEVLLSFDSQDLGLLTDSFRIGFAAGWCGPPEYYCDHFPDGWGYPYDGFSTSRWFDVRW